MLHGCRPSPPSCPEDGAPFCGSVWSSAGAGHRWYCCRLVPVLHCSGFLHRPFHVTCGSGLACRRPLGPRATFISSRVITTELSKRVPLGPCAEVACGPMRSSEACERNSCFDFHDWPSLHTQLPSSLILQESRFSFPFTHARPLFSWDEVHQVTHFNQVMSTMTSNTTTQSDYLCSPLKGDALRVPLFDRQSESMSRKNSASSLQVETLAERKRQVCRLLPLLPVHIRITVKKSTIGIQQGLVKLSLRTGWHIFLPAICSPPF